MDQKEQDVIKRLFARLDDCLVWNVTRVGSRTAEPDFDAYYELGGQIEQHDYLRNRHNFAPGEAEALLAFQDPLMVAQNCWYENRFTGFPICEILNDIGAYERFPLTREEQERRNKPKVRQLQERLDKNLADYTAALMNKSKSELVEDSAKIAETQAAYAYMRNDFDYACGGADLLLLLDDPLHYLASRWSMTFDLSGDDDDTILEIIEELKDPENLRHAQEAAASAPIEKPSVLGQLHKATQETGQRSSQEDKPHRKPDTPNL